MTIEPLHPFSSFGCSGSCAGTLVPLEISDVTLYSSLEIGALLEIGASLEVSCSLLDTGGSLETGGSLLDTGGSLLFGPGSGGTVSSAMLIVTLFK